MMEDRRRLTEDLIQVRLMLEPQLAALAAQNAAEEDYRNWNRSKRRLEDLIRQRKDYP